MKYRIEITDLKKYDATIFTSDPMEESELFEILPVLLKPSMFGHAIYFRVCVLPAGA